MRRTVAVLAGSVLVAALLTPTAASARPGDGGLSRADRTALSLGSQVAPKAPSSAKAPAGANPFLGLLPNPAKADYASWKRWLATKGEQRARQKAQLRALAPSPILVDEDEPAGTRDSNDTPATAQRVAGFGTAAGQNPKARILGTLSPEVVSTMSVAPDVEDDGSIPLARNTASAAPSTASAPPARSATDRTAARARARRPGTRRRHGTGRGIPLWSGRRPGGPAVRAGVTGTHNSTARLSE